MPDPRRITYTYPVGSLGQKVTDIMALTGDAVDNVPGVKGIGRKTAARLINHAGSLDALYISVLTGFTDHVLTTRVSTILRDGYSNAMISRELVRLDHPGHRMGRHHD